MKLIKLTTFYLNVEEELYVNPMHIGHMYNVPESIENYRTKRQHTRIGITTHNNGGFEVLESVEEILDKLNEVGYNTEEI